MGMFDGYDFNPIDDLADAAEGVKDAVVDTVTDATDAVVDTVTDATDAVVDTVTDATDAVVDTVTDAKEWGQRKWQDLGEIFEDPFYKPTYKPQEDRSATKGLNGDVRVSPEQLAALAGATRSVADQLVPTAATVETCGDGAPAQMPGFETGGALASCCHEWAGSLRKLTEEVKGIANTFQGNATGYTSAEQGNKGAFNGPR